MAAGNSGAVLGYSATGSQPGGSLASALGGGTPSAMLGVNDRGLAPTTLGFTPTTIGLTPAKRLAPGAYGSLAPPADLVAYGNGQVPAEALTNLSVEGHSLYAPAADAFEKMIAAAKNDGVTIGITDSYRPLATQERLAVEKGLYSQGGLAAAPGTSNHGWGLTLDLDLDAQAQEWMRAKAPDYGFVEDVPREPWHWTYRPANV